MVIPDDRIGLIQCINEYLDEKIKAFEFDEKLDEFRDSKDSTVRIIAFDLWYIYDDLIDHSIHATKDDWDSLQRLILLLASGAELVKEDFKYNKTYTLLRLSSAILLISYIAQAFIFLPGCVVWQMLSLAVNMVLDKQQESARKKTMPEDCVPFANFSEIRHAVQLCDGFRKKRYPRKIEERRIRSKVHELSLHVLNIPLYFCLQPLILVANLLQGAGSYFKVKFPDIYAVADN